MKKLFLAVPFSGVDRFVGALAEETICRHDSDPMQQFGKMEKTHVWVNRASGMYVHPSEGHSPSDIPDRTFMTHMVGIHNLPHNLTESEFMYQLKEKFDTTICMVPRNIEDNWKFPCVLQAKYKDAPGVNNLGFQKFLREQRGALLYDYEDSMYDQSIVDKITNSYNVLNAFATGTSGVSIIHPEDILGVGVEHRIDKINDVVGEWGIDAWQGIQKDENNLRIVKHFATYEAAHNINYLY